MEAAMTMPTTPIFLPPQDAQESLSWLDLWGYALTSPSKRTYEEILADPKAQKTPFLWIINATIIAFLIILGAQFLFGVFILPTEMQGDFTQTYSTNVLWSFLCGIPAAAIGGLLGFYISFGFQHILARLLGGRGTWQEYAFAAAAFFVPLIIIWGIYRSCFSASIH
jgi:hypothetical protein